MNEKGKEISLLGNPFRYLTGEDTKKNGIKAEPGPGLLSIEETDEGKNMGEEVKKDERDQ